MVWYDIGFTVLRVGMAICVGLLVVVLGFAYFAGFALRVGLRRVLVGGMIGFCDLLLW